MYTIHSQSRKSTYSTMLLALVTLLLGSCSRAHQLGMEDNPEEILERKLNEPRTELTPTQSVSLLGHCVALGEQNAATVANKSAITTLGETGTGKSTSVNYWVGCEMTRKTPEELEALGIQVGLEDVIVVDPESTKPEVAPIGHKIASHTFIPQIIEDPQCDTRVYLDCPGFSDNRGAEINIANAINIRKILQRAGGVKAVFLTRYQDFDRGLGIERMENMCQQLFGSVDNLRRRQHSVLLGITKAPLYTRNGKPFTQDRVCSVLTQSNTPIAQILANRLFLFDPLDRGHDNPDFWSLERCRSEIAQLQSIPNREAATLFQTVLTDSDRTHLLNTIRQLRPKITNAITQGEVAALGQHWQLLQRLQVIQHPEIEQLQGEVVLAINNAILQKVDAFKNDAQAHNFYSAGRTLNLLTRVQNNLPGASLTLDIDALRRHLDHCKEQYAAQRAREAEIARLEAEQQARERERERLERARLEAEAEREEIERRNRRVRLPFPYNLFLP